MRIADAGTSGLPDGNLEGLLLRNSESPSAKADAKDFSCSRTTLNRPSQPAKSDLPGMQKRGRLARIKWRGRTSGRVYGRLEGESL